MPDTSQHDLGVMNYKSQTIAVNYRSWYFYSKSALARSQFSFPERSKRMKLSETSGETNRQALPRSNLSSLLKESVHER